MFHFKLQVKSRESSVSDLTDPCQGLQKQSGLCAETLLIATKSLTVKCQPLSALLYQKFGFFLVPCLQVKMSRLLFSDVLLLYSVLVDILCYEKICAKKLLHLQSLI